MFYYVLYIAYILISRKFFKYEQSLQNCQTANGNNEKGMQLTGI